MRRKIIIPALALFSLGIVSCEKVLDLDSGTVTLTEEEALKTKEDVYRLLNSTYDVMANTLGGQIQQVAELMGDNVTFPADNNNLQEVYNHNTSIFNDNINAIYRNPYIAVFRTNRILEVIERFDFSSAEEAKLRAECSFIRAWAHFELLKLWAHPPGYSPANNHSGLVYKTYTEFAVLPRNTVAENYDQIIADLEAAAAILPISNGIYATQDAAHALLAKVYFQLGDYQQAVQYADQVINSNRYSLGDAVDRFLPDTILPENIFTIVSYNDGTFPDSRSYSFGIYRYTSNQPNPPRKISRELYDAFAGDTNDRRMKFLEVVAPVGSEEFVATTKFNEDYFNVPVLHLTDLRLLRAEALGELGNGHQTAIDDINAVRERAYGSALNNLPASATATEIIEAARYERRIEMYGEGDRINQLKRRGAIEGESIMVRGDNWDCNGMILQFPSIEESEAFQLNPGGGC